MSKQKDLQNRFWCLADDRHAARDHAIRRLRQSTFHCRQSKALRQGATPQLAARTLKREPKTIARVQRKDEGVQRIPQKRQGRLGLDPASSLSLGVPSREQSDARRGSYYADFRRRTRFAGASYSTLRPNFPTISIAPHRARQYVIFCASHRGIPAASARSCV
jgi:hypothetical protein